MHNAAELIRTDCVLVNFNGQQIDSTEIQNRKRFLKEQIYQTLNGNTIGKTVYVGFNCFDWVVPIMLATWELGSNVFVHDLNYEFTRIPEFADFYNFIDLSIVPDRTTFTQFATPAIDPFNYTGIQYQFDDHVTVSADTVAMKTHTSGTTGRPKIIDFTHQHLIDRTQVIASYHGYNHKDKPFHFKTFHHGALFIDYALPLLSVAAEHHFIDPLTPAICGDGYNARTYLNLVMPYIRDNKITAILMPYEWINYFDQVTPVDMEGRLSIRTLRGYDAITAAWIFENINPKEIVNQFGCSELGTMFISRVTVDNYKNYVHNLFTERAPGLEYVLEKNLVRARRQGYEWHILADGFVEDGDRLYYQGRSYAFATDDKPIFIQDLENYLRTIYHPTKFQLVPDFVESKLYLALFDSTIDTDVDRINKLVVTNVSSRHCVTDVRYFNLRDVVTGIKPSGQILLYAFTKDQNDIQSH